MMAHQMHPASWQYANSAGSRFIGRFLVVRLAGQERPHLFIVGQGTGAVFTHPSAEHHPGVALQWRQPLIEQQGEGHAHVVRRCVDSDGRLS